MRTESCSIEWHPGKEGRVLLSSWSWRMGVLLGIMVIMLMKYPGFTGSCFWRSGLLDHALKGWNGTLFLSTQPSGWRDRLRKRKFIGRLSIWCKRKLHVLTVVGISSSMTCLKCLLSFILMVKLVSV